MTQSITNSFAALAALIIACSSIGAIVTVPPASAQSTSTIIELA